VGGIGRASGKLILFGEHAAVYGHPAVGVSLQEKITVRLWADEMADWDLSDIPSRDRATIRRILALLEGLLPGRASPSRCRVTVLSDVPRGVGFGSSAALCAALARAVLAHAGAFAQPDGLSAAEGPGNPFEEWELAHSAEKLFHGTPSGIDTGLSILDGLFAFRPRPPALPEYQPLSGAPLHLVVSAVPRAESCSALVASLGERMRAGHQETRDAIQDLGEMAAAAHKALCGPAADGAKDIAALADKAMERLRALGLGSPWQDRLLEAGKKAGALGGKLSGAGGGGAFFLVARDAAGAQRVASSLEQEASRGGITFAAPVRLLMTS
jgi:mevalonate kinase